MQKKCDMVITMDKRNYKEGIGQRLKLLRKELHLSQMEASKKLNIAVGYYSDLENERRPMNERILKLIIITFFVNENWIRNDSGEMFKSMDAQKMDRIISLFSELKPEYQDYILNQIEELLKIQNT